MTERGEIAEKRGRKSRRKEERGTKEKREITERE